MAAESGGLLGTRRIRVGHRSCASRRHSVGAPNQPRRVFRHGKPLPQSPVRSCPAGRARRSLSMRLRSPGVAGRPPFSFRLQGAPPRLARGVALSATQRGPGCDVRCAKATRPLPEKCALQPLSSALTAAQAGRSPRSRPIAPADGTQDGPAREQGQEQDVVDFRTATAQISRLQGFSDAPGCIRTSGFQVMSAKKDVAMRGNPHRCRRYLR